MVGGPTYTGAGYPAAYRNSIFFGDFTGGFVRRLVPNGAGGFSVQPFATGWGGVALETAPNGDLVSVNPVNFGVNGAGTVTRITYAPPGPAPPASPPPPAPAPPADTRGPRLRLGSIRPRRGLVSGTARDQSGVRRVEVAVRRRLRGRGCSWWLRSQGRMARKRLRCDRPRWMRAKLRRVESGVRWSVRLRGRLPAGTYRVLVKATDRRGNVARLRPSRASVVKVRKR